MYLKHPVNHAPKNDAHSALSAAHARFGSGLTERLINGMPNVWIKPWSGLRGLLAGSGVALFTLCMSPLADAKSYYDEAEVVEVTPVYKTVVRREPHQECRIVEVAHEASSHRSATPGIVGAIIGGAIGNSVGAKEPNKKVGAVVGSILGYSIGRDVGHRNRRPSQVTYSEEEVCEVRYERVEEDRLAGYDVSYVYGGRTYQTRMKHRPGSVIRVRVKVRPA